MIVILGITLVDSGRLFARGVEYYYLGGDTTRRWSAESLRTWHLGAQLWCPASGGLRVLGQDLDFDDDGHLDLVLASNDQRPTWVAWGPDFSERTALNPDVLPRLWTQGICVADIDADGQLELSVANETFVAPMKCYIYKYVGGRGFALVDSISEDYCLCPQSVQFADLNNDGWVDLVLSNHQDPETHSANIHSYIFYGPGPFWGREPDLALPTYGGHLTRVADLNGDGWLDVLFSSNRADGEGWSGWLVIYWGSEEGFDSTNAMALRVNNNWESQVADLNRDGWLDIVAACGKDDIGYYTYDKIFWGPGFSRVSLLPGIGSSNVSIADLNKDGTLDIVLSNWATGTHGNETLGVYSFVRYGPDYVSGPVDSLFGWGAHGNLVADFNDDGWPDVFLGCEMTSWGEYAETSYVYWGSPEGLGDERSPVLSWGFNDGVWLDLGNLYDRAPAFRYLSRAFLFSKPQKLKSLRVYGNFPEGTGVEAWARALNGSEWGDWLRAEELASSPVSGSAFQYRLVLRTDYKRTSLLRVDSVVLELEETGVREGPAAPNLRQVGRRLLYASPNPAQLRVCDSAGRTVLSRELPPGSGEVSLEALPDGVYLAQLGKLKLKILLR